jgi:hypothetical protein
MHTPGFAICVILLSALAGCTSQKDFLPDEFLGLSLHKKLEGAKAVEFVDRMHLQRVASVKNEIGFYVGEKGKATIYVTHYGDPEAAATEEKKMTDKISPENSVFIMGEHKEVDGKPVYRCFGMGQTHYVFSDREQLFWISVETLMADSFLRAYLDYLN